MSARTDAELDDAMELLTIILAPCEGADVHTWRRCKHCAAVHGIDNRFPLTMRLLARLKTEIDALWAAREAQHEVCICAAIQLPSGELFRGHRHDDALQTAGKASVEREAIYAAEQGFITSRNRFVTREEGARLHRAAGIPSAQTGELPNGMLFSEDLYLRETMGQLRVAAPEKGEQS